MLVYRSPRATLDPGIVLAELEAGARRLQAANAASRDGWVELLIDAGQLESGVADALSPEVDGPECVIGAVREVTLCCARGERAAWHGSGSDVLGIAARRVVDAIAAVRAHRVPSTCSVGVPEGYAYYAVYPESYGEAARRFARVATPARVTCVGIRTIGTSLSAVVAAELERFCSDVRTWTVRPHGHPFDRTVRLTAELRDLIAERRDGYALIVDEGPGLSGSSFVAVADALARLGFSDERIVLFPSWAADGSTLNNDHARSRWRQLARYVVEFDDIWLANGRLARLAGGATRDISGGLWREHFISDRLRWPAVQPQHEQRKYLVTANTPDDSPALLKFVGIGRYGRTRLERAERLAQAGFAARPLGLDGGFLRSDLAPGTPLVAAASDDALAERVADYLAFVRRAFPTGLFASFDDVAEMIELNTREALGAWPAGTTSLADWRAAVEESEVVAIDGRMLAHEWIRCDRGGYLKADGLSHHDDHFWPGCQDIAWDVAAAIVELRLTTPRARDLVERYRRASGDAGIAARLPFWRVAYLASRLGYVAMAAGTLGPTSDGRRMRRLERRYAAALRRSLAALRPPGGVRSVAS